METKDKFQRYKVTKTVEEVWMSKGEAVAKTPEEALEKFQKGNTRFSLEDERKTISAVETYKVEAITE